MLSLGPGLAVAVGTGLSPTALISAAGRYGGPGHAAVAGWLLGAPVLLALAWLATRWTLWPWVVAVAVELLAATVTLVRYAHLVPSWLWAGYVVLVVNALASLVTGPTSGRPRRSAGPDA